MQARLGIAFGLLKKLCRLRIGYSDIYELLRVERVVRQARALLDRKLLVSKDCLAEGGYRDTQSTQ